jgi:hypothetical protein
MNPGQQMLLLMIIGIVAILVVQGLLNKRK